MPRIRDFAIFVLLLATAPALGEQPSAAQRQSVALAVLRSNAPPAGKALACKQLAICGDRDAVPALAPLLADPQLASWARIALEAIPDAAADEALRAALGKLQGKLLVGAVNSIGVRRDARAVAALAKRLIDRDPEVVSAAGAALGKIGTPAAAAVLEQYRGAARRETCAAAAEGLILCAEKLLADGQRDAAARIYDRVRTGLVPKQRIIEATRGAILARGAAGVPLLVAQLKSPDKDFFGIALRTARELGGPEVAQALLHELDALQPDPKASKILAIVEAQYGAGDRQLDVTDKLSAALGNNKLFIEISNVMAGSDPAPGAMKQLRLTYSIGGRQATTVVPEGRTLALGGAGPGANLRQIWLIDTLGDLGQAAALPALQKAARGGSWGTRLAAVRALGRLGNASAADVLLDIASSSSGELSQAAVSVLADLPGKELDHALCARLPGASGPARAMLVRLIGERRVEAAVPALLKAVDDPDAQIRSAALEALGGTIGLGNLPLLIARTLRPQNAAEGAAAQDALSTACVRMPDREACAQLLTAAMPQAAAPFKRKLLEILGAVGGKQALTAIATAAKDPDPKTQDVATRLLGQWMSADAAGVLLDLAQTAGDAKLRTRALRGYLRIARQLAPAGAARVAMCRQAAPLCQRDEERKLVIEVSLLNPSAESLALVTPYLGQPALAKDAATAAVAIAVKIVQAQPQAVAAAMQQVLAANVAGAPTARAKQLLEAASARGAKRP